MLGGGGGVVAVSGASTCCASSWIGGKSRTMLSAVFGRSRLGSSSSSAIGLSVLTASAGGGSPGREVQQTGWLLSPSNELGGR
jgi:hypothetical protein